LFVNVPSSKPCDTLACSRETKVVDLRSDLGLWPRE